MDKKVRLFFSWKLQRFKQTTYKNVEIFSQPDPWSFWRIKSFTPIYNDPLKLYLNRHFSFTILSNVEY